MIPLGWIGRKTSTQTKPIYRELWVILEHPLSVTQCIRSNYCSIEAYNSTNGAMTLKMTYRRKEPYMYHWLTGFSWMSLYSPCSKLISALEMFSSLTFTMLRANSTDNNLMIFFFFRKHDLTLHANCLLRRQFAWNVKPCFLEQIRRIFQNIVCWFVFFFVQRGCVIIISVNI